MDATQALADLTEISSQVEAAVLFDEGGGVAASTLSDDAAAALAHAAGRLLDRAGTSATQVEAATPDGSVFVVREGSRCIAATTGPDPTTGLVFYDLKSALQDAEPPKRRRTRKATDEA